MAGNPLRKVRPGDPLDISADTFNTLIDTAAWKKLQERRQSREKQSRTVPNPAVILVRNASGADRFQGEALGLTDAIFGPDENLEGFKGQVAVVGVALDQEKHRGRVAILLEPAADGRLARAAVAGVVAAKVNIASEAHKYAAPVEGNDRILSSIASGGYRIIYKPTGDGELWCYVQLNESADGTLIGKTTSTITARVDATPGSGTMEIYTLAAPPSQEGQRSLSATGITLTIYNLGDEVAPDTWCQAKLEPFSGEYFGDWAYCG